MTENFKTLKKHGMAKATKSPRERLSIKRSKFKKGPVETDNAWYDKAYARFSIVKKNTNITTTTHARSDKNYKI